MYGKLETNQSGGQHVEPVDLLPLLSESQPRRLRVVENLLRGRRTVSTLYWGQRYHLLSLLNLNKTLARGGLDDTAAVLVAHGWAQIDAEKETVQLTAAGAAQRDAKVYYQPVTAEQWPYLDHQALRARLFLAIQVVSQYAHSQAQYYPLQVDLAARQAVRRWFHTMKAPTLAATISAALTASLTKIPTMAADVLTAQFTGFNQPGVTSEQQAQLTGKTTWELYLMQLDGLTQVALDARQPTHPLHSLVAALWQPPVARSAQVTLAAVQAGQTLTQIAATRHVKLSTVREHLLEAAIMLSLTDFPYAQLLPATTRQDFQTVVSGPIDEWQYGDLPETVQNQYDFFDFRLFAIWCGKQEA
nr:helix-turn-helix domain-containing protein [Levilactobacillus brevis]